MYDVPLALEALALRPFLLPTTAVSPSTLSRMASCVTQPATIPSIRRSLVPTPTKPFTTPLLFQVIAMPIVPSALPPRVR